MPTAQADAAQALALSYGTISTVVMLVYDWLTTLDEEIYYIWARASGISGRPLYFFIRYLGMSYQLYNLVVTLGYWPNLAFCRVFFALVPVGTLSFLYAIDLLLAYRALCLYRMKRTLLIVNCALFGASVTSGIALSVLTISSIQVTQGPLYLPACWDGRESKYNFLVPIPGLLFEFWIFTLVVVKMILYSRQRGWKWIREGGVMTLLIRDSLWWFFAIAFLIILNIIVLASLPDFAVAITLSLFRSGVVILACRLIINMRKAALRSQGGEMTWATVRGPPGQNTLRSRSSFRRAEDKRLSRALDLAQRAGLPPPLSQDLIAMWFEPVTTLNHATAACTIELEVVPSSSPSTDLDFAMERKKPLRLETSNIVATIPVYEMSPISYRRRTGEFSPGISPERWRNLEED